MKKFILLFLLAMNSVTFAQEIRTSVGFAGYGNPFDGLYFSFDYGIPVYNGIEIAPTFTFNTNMKYSRIQYYANDYDNENYIIDKNHNSGGRISGLFELYLLINPIKLINSKTKQDLYLGVGYGYSFYTHNYYNYYNNQFIGVRNDSGIRNSLSTRIFYNYHFKKMFVGINFGAVDLLDDGNSILGIQIGKKL